MLLLKQTNDQFRYQNVEVEHYVAKSTLRNDIVNLLPKINIKMLHLAAFLD